MIELLAPAGDLERLKLAFYYGADAVYLGGRDFSLRANAKNFSKDDIKEACSYAHNLNKKVYVTVNIVFHDDDYKNLEEYLKYLDECGVDAIIVSDISVMELWKKLDLNMELHVSTQASILNKESALFYKKMGASRIVLAREASKSDIEIIKAYTNLDLEVFIHGAMCTSISGKCIMSNYLTNRDANRGGCAQICRWCFKYYNNNKLIDDNFQMSPKDLNMAKYIKDMIDIGVNSLKIEGRMRSGYYLATVLLCYRRIINKIMNNSLTTDDTNYYVKVLNRCANRESTSHFFDKFPTYNEQYYTNSREEASNQDFLGIVLDNSDGIITIEQRNYFKKGDAVQFISPNFETFTYNIETFYDEDMNEIDIANHPQMIIKIKENLPLQKNDIMRLKIIDN